MMFQLQWLYSVKATMNCKQVRIWKEMVVVCIKLVSKGGTEENHEKLRTVSNQSEI
jgi:hypothetical protein